MPVGSERTFRPGTRTFDDQSMFPRGHGLQMPGTSEGTSPWMSKRTATLHDDPATSTTGALCPTPPYSGMPVHLNDKSFAEFPNWDWPAIEHWAERGLLKPDVWKARRTNLSLIVKLEIPISGTAIQIQQQALQLDQVPDSWPCNLESGWAAHYGRLEMPFEALCLFFPASALWPVWPGQSTVSVGRKLYRSI